MKQDALVQTEFLQGVVKHLQFHPKELEIYTEQLEKALQRYIRRLQWLLSGIAVPLVFCKAKLKYRQNLLVCHFY